jgi:hypothetical protein
MAGRNEEFETGRLWHGSNADLQPGDTIEPRGSYIDGKYSTAPEHRIAFATPHFNEAANHGDNVYEVKYHEGEKPETTPESQGQRFVSRQKGFKVVGRTTYKDYHYPKDEDD